MAKKCLAIIRSFLPIFDEYKIFAKVSHASGKFDEKYDDEIANPVLQTIL